MGLVNQSVMRMTLSFEPCKHNIGQVNIAMANHHIFIAEYFRLSSQPAMFHSYVRLPKGDRQCEGPGWLPQDGTEISAADWKYIYIILPETMIPSDLFETKEISQVYLMALVSFCTSNHYCMTGSPRNVPCTTLQCRRSCTSWVEPCALVVLNDAVHFAKTSRGCDVLVIWLRVTTGTGFA